MIPGIVAVICLYKIGSLVSMKIDKTVTVCDLCLHINVNLMEMSYVLPQMTDYYSGYVIVPNGTQWYMDKRDVIAGVMAIMFIYGGICDI